MSDDIDRLKTVLDDLAQVSDTLKDNNEAMSDVVNAVRAVELETDPEGHGALRDITNDIRLAYGQLEERSRTLNSLVWKLMVKARVS